MYTCVCIGVLQEGVDRWDGTVCSCGNCHTANASLPLSLSLSLSTSPQPECGWVCVCVCVRVCTCMFGLCECLYIYIYYIYVCVYVCVVLLHGTVSTSKPREGCALCRSALSLCDIHLFSGFLSNTCCTRIVSCETFIMTVICQVPARLWNK